MAGSRVKTGCDWVAPGLAAAGSACRREFHLANHPRRAIPAVHQGWRCTEQLLSGCAAVVTARGGGWYSCRRLLALRRVGSGFQLPDGGAGVVGGVAATAAIAALK